MAFLCWDLVLQMLFFFSCYHIIEGFFVALVLHIVAGDICKSTLEQLKMWEAL